MGVGKIENAKGEGEGGVGGGAKRLTSCASALIEVKISCGQALKKTQTQTRSVFLNFESCYPNELLALKGERLWAHMRKRHR